MANKLTRRSFLKKSAIVAGSAVSFPAIVPSSVFGANAPSNRINLGCIGVGNQGMYDMRGFMQNDDVQVVAVCDINRGSYGYKRPDQLRGREPARKVVNGYYANKTGNPSYNACGAYSDFREVLARDDVDAVLVVVPDHWHAIIAIAAAKAGKDIYCEKPLTRTIGEGRALVNAVNKYGVILQTGSHFRSLFRTRLVCEIVRNKRIGELKKIVTVVGPNTKTAPPSDWKPMPIPEGFDYDTWLGPAPYAPYHKDRCLYTFRFVKDYSGGQTTNLGAHSIDMAQWGNDTDASGPVMIEDLGGEFPKDGLFNTATKVAFRCVYANGVELSCNTVRVPGVMFPLGARFEGTEGWIQVGSGFGGPRFNSHPKSLMSTVIEPNEIHLYESNDHYRNFIDCVKTRKEPIAPVEAGHRSASICHLGNIAMELGRKLQWDPEKELFINDDEANRFVNRPMRGQWHL